MADNGKKNIGQRFLAWLEAKQKTASRKPKQPLPPWGMLPFLLVPGVLMGFIPETRRQQSWITVAVVVLSILPTVILGVQTGRIPPFELDAGYATMGPEEVWDSVAGTTVWLVSFALLLTYMAGLLFRYAYANREKGITPAILAVALLAVTWLPYFQLQSRLTLWEGHMEGTLASYSNLMETYRALVGEEDESIDSDIYRFALMQMMIKAMDPTSELGDTQDREGFANWKANQERRRLEMETRANPEAVD